MTNVFSFEKILYHGLEYSSLLYLEHTIMCYFDLSFENIIVLFTIW